MKKVMVKAPKSLIEANRKFILEYFTDFFAKYGKLCNVRNFKRIEMDEEYNEKLHKYNPDQRCSKDFCLLTKEGVMHGHLKYIKNEKGKEGLFLYLNCHCVCHPIKEIIALIENSDYFISKLFIESEDVPSLKRLLLMND